MYVIFEQRVYKCTELLYLLAVEYVNIYYFLPETFYLLPVLIIITSPCVTLVRDTSSVTLIRYHAFTRISTFNI